MLLLIKPILFAFLQSDAVKKLVVDLLTAYVEKTDNKVDDKAVALIKEKFGDIYMGEPFLTQKKSMNDLWFDITGQLLKNAWQGFLSGLYDKQIMDFECVTELTKQTALDIADNV